MEVGREQPKSVSSTIWIGPWAVLTRNFVILIGSAYLRSIRRAAAGFKRTSRKLPPISKMLCWRNWKPEPSKISVRSIQNNSSSSSARICRKDYSPTPGMAETEIRLVGDYLDILASGWHAGREENTA